MNYSINNVDEQYIDLCRRILDEGVRKDDRTGTGTRSVFGHQMRIDLADGFPLLTTKRVPFRLVAEELLWFLSGSTDVKDLLDKYVNIWNADAYRHYLETGGEHDYDKFIEMVGKFGFDLGPIYGHNWRRLEHYDHSVEFGGISYRKIDQIADVIHSIKHNPDSRRHIVSAWNVGQLEDQALPPCHTMFQFYVANGRLSCQLYQRSADVFLGLPFNIASYALLTHMIAQVTGLQVGEFVHTIGDAHIYENHIDQVREQLTRQPLALPVLRLDESVTDIDDFTYDHIELLGYAPHPAIKGEVSVGLKESD